MDQGLSIAFGVIFVIPLVGQSVAGSAHENEKLSMHELPPISYLEFVTTSDFLVDVAENRHSERSWIYANSLFIVMGTIFLASGSRSPWGTHHRQSGQR